MKKTIRLLILLAAPFICAASICSVSARDIVFRDSACPLEVRTDPADENSSEVLELSSLHVYGVYNWEKGSFALIGAGENGLGYVPLDKLQTEIPSLDVSELPSTDSSLLVGPGTAGETARQIQSMLITLGLLPGAADGDYGNGTAAAVSAFQQQAGLEPTGTVDAVTWLILWDTVYGNNTPLETVYPDVVKAEDKFAEIYESVRDQEILDLFLDPSWSFTYDIYEKMGEITQGQILGTWTDETGRPIDRLTMTAESMIFVMEDDTETVQLFPAIRISTRGAYRPYIQSLYLVKDKEAGECQTMYSTGALDGIEVEETTVLSMSEKASGILEEGGFGIHVKGVNREYDLVMS